MAALSPAQRKRLERRRRKMGIPPDPSRSARAAKWARPVTDLSTGESYPSIAAAAFATGASESSIREALDGGRLCPGERWVAAPGGTSTLDESTHRS